MGNNLNLHEDGAAVPEKTISFFKWPMIKLLVNVFTAQIFGFAWSPDGSFCATVCKDGKVRVYEPRQGGSPSQEGPGPEGTRGARLIWVLGGKYIIVSGFDK